jgi:DnaJ-class molecular chaperone
MRDEIERAYSVLSDPARRATYDRVQSAEPTNDQRPKTND